MEIEDFRKAEQLVRDIDYIIQDIEKINNAVYNEEDIYVSINFENKRGLDVREEISVKIIKVLKDDLEKQLKELHNKLEKI